MTGRVPDAAGWWWRETGNGESPIAVRVRRVGPELRWNPPGSNWPFDVSDETLPGKWLGPVAPPCPEGRVRVEMSRDLAAFGAEFAEQTRDKLANQPDPVGSWLCEGRESLRRLAESLRTALAKGAE